MKDILLILISYFTVITSSIAQTPEEYYKAAIAKTDSQDYEEAIKLYDKTIELQPENYYAWYNRGLLKSRIYLYEEALIDLEQTTKLAPDYKKGFLNRGIIKRYLTDYYGAIADYEHSISLDSNYAEAYFNRGLILELFSKKDSACLDFNKALSLGLKSAQKKVDRCNDTSNIKLYSILRLTKTADNKKYGFNSFYPIKVGTGPNGGPANQRAYLNLLMDSQHKVIKYERTGSCCAYKSENALYGEALVDMYVITYLDEKNKVQKATVYLSFYDYEEPMILYGFGTVRR